MKRNKFLYLVIAVLVTVFTLLTYQKVSAAGEDVFNQAVVYRYDVGYVKYSGSITFADSVSNYHTKPFFIGNANSTDGMITTNITSGYTAASACTVIVHYSNDLENWFTQTNFDSDLDLDAVQNRADTLGQINGSNDSYFHGFNWVILEFDGETSNPADSKLEWCVNLIPNVSVVDGNGQALNLGRVASRANAVP